MKISIKFLSTKEINIQPNLLYRLTYYFILFKSLCVMCHINNHITCYIIII